MVWKTDNSRKLSLIPKETPAGEKWREVGRLKLATFGIDWAYFFLQTDGIFHYNFMGCYNTLGDIMKNYRLRAGDIKVKVSGNRQMSRYQFMKHSTHEGLQDYSPSQETNLASTVHRAEPLLR